MNSHVTIKINIQGRAFGDDECAEVAFILQRLALLLKEKSNRELRAVTDDAWLYDSEANVCGVFDVRNGKIKL